MATQKFQFNVTMTCSGCSNAVNRVLQRLDGISDVDISLENQTVDVTSNGVDFDTVFNTIAKTGKKINGGKVVA